MSRYLMRDSIYDGLIAQMHEIGRTIPPKALVILPESWAGIHLEIPLQYSEGIDTLLLPLDGPLHPNLANTIGSYLARESQHRPVVAMLSSTKDPPKLLRRLFDLKIRTNQLIQFMMIPRTRNLVFPEKSEMASIPCVIYDLSPRMKTPEKSVLSYNEPNVTFVNFHDKENGFRWTNQKSTIENFSYTTNNKSISAVLSTMPAFSFYDHRSLELSLIINGQFSLQPFKVENGNYLFDIDGRSIPKITSVTIESRTFRPVDHHVNSDSRDLGVSFVELRFRRK